MIADEKNVSDVYFDDLSPVIVQYASGYPSELLNVATPWTCGTVGTWFLNASVDLKG